MPWFSIRGTVRRCQRIPHYLDLCWRDPASPATTMPARNPVPRPVNSRSTIALSGFAADPHLPWIWRERFGASRHGGGIGRRGARGRQLETVITIGRNTHEKVLSRL